MAFFVIENTYSRGKHFSAAAWLCPQQLKQFQHSEIVNLRHMPDGAVPSAVNALDWVITREGPGTTIATFTSLVHLSVVRERHYELLQFRVVIN